MWPKRKEREKQKEWEAPTFEDFNWSVLKDQNEHQQKQNEEKKAARTKLEKQKLAYKGYSIVYPREIKAIWKKRDASAVGRPPLQFDNAMYNQYLKRLVIDKNNYLSTPRLWGLIQADPNAPKGLSKRYVERARQIFEVLAVHHRWIEDNDILRRVPKSGETARFKRGSLTCDRSASMTALCTAWSVPTGFQNISGRNP